MLAALFEAASRPFIKDTGVRLALRLADVHYRDPSDPYAPLRPHNSVFLGLPFNSICMTPEKRAIPCGAVHFLGGFNDGSPSL